MRSNRDNRFTLLFAALTFIVALSASSGSAFAQETPTPEVAQPAQAHDFSNIKIKNFGQMDERFFRGAQPKEKDYAQLAALGIKTIIDLREDPTSYEKTNAEAVGMRYVNIPMSDKEYPKTEQIDQFISLIKDDTTGKFFVHCAGGRHRTGVMGAVYRFNNYNWDYEKVYAEMKQYDFYTRWGHGDMKKFVQDYAVSFKQNQPTSAQVTAAPAAIKK
jgi:protein tyrosine/serine phosphatase